MGKGYRTTSHILGGNNKRYNAKCRELESQDFHYKSGRLVSIEGVSIYVKLYIKDQPTLREAVQEFMIDNNYSHNHVSAHKSEIAAAYLRETDVEED